MLKIGRGNTYMYILDINISEYSITNAFLALMQYSKIMKCSELIRLFYLF